MRADDLQAELVAELAASNFADYGAAVAAINNGIRAAAT
jgi:hypothetical protein